MHIHTPSGNDKTECEREIAMDCDLDSNRDGRGLSKIAVRTVMEGSNENHRNLNKKQV